MQPPCDPEIGDRDDVAAPAEPSWRAPLRCALLVLWPSFLMAGVLEMLMFALVDPASLHGLGGAALGWPAQAVHTVAFFVFWSATAAASATTQWLGRDARSPRLH
jgi:hypothetical protein